MPLVPLIDPRRRVRVVLSSTALLSFMSVRKAAALALAQLGAAAFFIAGVGTAVLGPRAGWFVLAAVVLAAFVRAIDIESWAVFIPGGFVGRVEYAFGPSLAGTAAATVLTERFVLAALAVVVAGHYASGVAVTAIAGLRLTGLLRPEDFATMLAVVMVGLLWIRARVGLDLRSDTIARGVWIGVGVLVLTALWSVVSAVRTAPPLAPLVSLPAPVPTLRWYLDAGLTCLIGPLSRPSRDWWRGSARPGGARAGAASRAGTAQDRSPDVGVRAVRDHTHHLPVCSSDTGDRASRLDHRAAWLVLRSIWPRRDGCATSWQSASSSRQS